MTNNPSPAFDRLHVKPPVSDEGRRAGKAILAILLGAAFCLFVGILVINSSGSEPPLTLPERMKRECERQFGTADQIRVNDCAIKLTIRYYTEQNQEKMNSAYQRGR